MSIMYFKGTGIYKLKAVILPVIEELAKMLDFLQGKVLAPFIGKMGYCQRSLNNQWFGVR